jgi:sulfide:quinone oxidoreductase
MPESPLRVVIAGGGVAGLETLAALRSLGGETVELTLVAPEDEFVYRPLSAEEPFAVGRIRQLPLVDAARDAKASFLATTIEAVDADKKVVSTSQGKQFEYDALVLAVGATAVPTVAHAMTWDDRSEAEMLGGLVRDFEEGYARRLAVVIPPGPTWPLRAYELALFITMNAKSMSVDIKTTIVTPEPSPLEILGSRAIELVSNELEQAGVDVVSAERADVEPGHAATVVVRPSGLRLEVDRLLALPTLRGRGVPGVPVDDEGFVDIDAHCRVCGLNSVWAAGDGTAFPLNSAGFAAEQAHVAAQEIAARAGAAVEPRPFDPTDRADLAGLPSRSYLKTLLAEGDEGQTTDLPLGLPVLTYLRLDLEASWRGQN